jgi:hypothetical protein
MKFSSADCVTFCHSTFSASFRDAQTESIFVFAGTALGKHFSAEWHLIQSFSTGTTQKNSLYFHAEQKKIEPSKRRGGEETVSTHPAES